MPDVQTGHQLRFWISSIQHASFHASQTDVQVLSPDAEEELDCIEERSTAREFEAVVPESGCWKLVFSFAFELLLAYFDG